MTNNTKEHVNCVLKLVGESFRHYMASNNKSISLRNLCALCNMGEHFAISDEKFLAFADPLLASYEESMTNYTRSMNVVLDKLVQLHNLLLLRIVIYDIKTHYDKNMTTADDYKKKMFFEKIVHVYESGLGYSITYDDHTYEKHMIETKKSNIAKKCVMKMASQSNENSTRPINKFLNCSDMVLRVLDFL